MNSFINTFLFYPILGIPLIFIVCGFFVLTIIVTQVDYNLSKGASMNDRQNVMGLVKHFLRVIYYKCLKIKIKLKVFFTGSVKMYWWKHPVFPNFGDELGPEIIQKLFHIKCDLAPDRQSAELLSVGSILNETHGGIEHGGRYFIWGSGFNDPNFKPVRNWLKICAVRGKITQDRLGVKNIPLGDPGILSNLVYKASPNENKIGIIPHYSEMASHALEEFKNNSRFIIISPARKPAAVISDITKCSIIFSSSMHGLIVADSYGIPNYHIELSSNVEGGNLKYDDYYSAVAKPHIKVDFTKISDFEYVDSLMNSYRAIPNLVDIQRGLIKAFPFMTARGGV